MAKKTKSDGADSLLTAAKAELQAQLNVCAVRRVALHKGGFDKDLANASAALGRAIASLSGEERQQEKHAKQMVERMSAAEQDALVHEYVAALPSDRRAAFRSFLNQLDDEEKVLGL